MAIEKVQITVTTIADLLQNGYTWFKKDDLGYGSIQEKFQAGDTHIHAIRKHPLLKDLDTTARVFVIIDDTKEQTNETNTTPLSVDEPTDDSNLGEVFGTRENTTNNTVNDESSLRNRSVGENISESASAFADL